MINPETIVSECLKTALNLKTYKTIIDTVNSSNFKATDEFRKIFNGFYKIRQRNAEWYNTYYKLMEEQKEKNRTFGECLEKCIKLIERLKFHL